VGWGGLCFLEEKIKSRSCKLRSVWAFPPSCCYTYGGIIVPDKCNTAAGWAPRPLAWASPSQRLTYSSPPLARPRSCRPPDHPTLRVVTHTGGIIVPVMCNTVAGGASAGIAVGVGRALAEQYGKRRWLARDVLCPGVNRSRRNAGSRVPLSAPRRPASGRVTDDEDKRVPHKMSRDYAGLAPRPVLTGSEIEAWLGVGHGAPGRGRQRACDSPISGFFSGTATFGPGEPNETTLTSVGGTDCFIAKYR
jgi:hypothetical protein